MRDVVTNEWFTVLIVFCLAILAIAKYAYDKRFSDFLTVVGNSKYLKIYSRDQKFIDQFDALLFINLIISSSIFFYIAYATLVVETNFESVLFFKIAISIGALILIKILLERLIASVFEIDALIDSYIFQKTNYKNYLGLVLLPINITFLYALEPSKTLIYISLTLLLLINTIGFFSSFKTHQKLILNNWFYFILYLCALEIGPYVILYKVFN